MEAGVRPRARRIVGWSLLALLVAFFLSVAVPYRFLVSGRLGPSWWDRQFWFYSHLLFGMAALLLGALQFSRTIRSRAAQLHRLSGRCYVAAATLSALAGIWLAVTSELPGRRAPLALLGLLWLWFTLAGWREARGRRFDAHRRMMIRPYVTALVFVWARLLAGPPLGPIPFGFIADPALRDATAIWIAVVGPVLLLDALDFLGQPARN